MRGEVGRSKLRIKLVFQKKGAGNRSGVRKVNARFVKGMMKRTAEIHLKESKEINGQDGKKTWTLRDMDCGGGILRHIAMLWIGIDGWHVGCLEYRSRWEEKSWPTEGKGGVIQP